MKYSRFTKKIYYDKPKTVTSSAFTAINIPVIYEFIFSYTLDLKFLSYSEQDDLQAHLQI